MNTRWIAGTGAAVLAMAVAGCGSTQPAKSSAPSRYAYQAKQARVAGCAQSGKAIPLPAAFPAQFPMISGTSIDAVRKLGPGQIGIYGFVPSSAFYGTVNFFKNTVPKVGFKLLDFEVDAPHDSEGAYQGFGSIGRWSLRALPGCAKAMSFSASAEPVKTQTK
ncbi:MAG: hypothetical protein ACRDFX_10695 [Chloroflexota bacterium]